MADQKYQGIIEFVAVKEGRTNGFIGYVNHPRDPGGETCCGISRRAWPRWEGWAIVDRYKTGILPEMIASGTDYDRALSRDPVLWEMIKAFYKKEFWDIYFLDGNNSARAALLIFDSAILIAPVIALWAQQVTNDLWASIGPEMNGFRIKVDGAIGPATTQSMNSLWKTIINGRPGDLVWGAEFLDRREEFHREHVLRHPDQDVFLAGWLNRVDDLRRKIGV